MKEKLLNDLIEVVKPLGDDEEVNDVIEILYFEYNYNDSYEEFKNELLDITVPEGNEGIEEYMIAIRKVLNKY